MSETLKPEGCPFCSAVPVRATWHTKMWDVPHAEDCWAKAWPLFESGIAAWNRRSAPHPQREAVRERVAKAIYNEMPYDGNAEKPKWIDGGNSYKQDEARRKALAALEGTEG